MVFQHNGKSFTNADAYRTAKATQSAKPMSDQQAAVQSAGGKPVMTHHHPEGGHTTQHDDGSSHDSQNLEELKQHLDKFFTEEEGEGSEAKSDAGDDW